jgi:uncharacterized membrane protein
MMSLAEAPIFEALIVPHRSLTRKGVLIFLGALLVLTVAVALRFWLLGAWPVVAFSFVEIPLLVVLLAINQRRARASELIMLDATQLTVIRTDPAGRRKQELLPAAWLRVDLNATKGVPRIVLSSRGRDCEVGAFLHEPDKVSLFGALKTALHHVKNPRFDNPQLREE